MTSDNVKTGIMLAALAAAGYVAWQGYKKAGAIGQTAAQAWDSVTNGAAKVGGWVNPLSDQNLAYQGVNAAGSAYTGDSAWTLGGAVYEAQEARGFSNPWQIFTPAAAGTITNELKGFFGVGEEIKSGGGGQFNGNGASGKW